MSLDEFYMRRALALAEATVGLASPNPQVGCVLVRDGLILGEGAHVYDQFDHAEIAALKQARAAGHDPGGATAYVTLEPCSHHGRTGPCADALIQAGIARCFAATTDPNPLVSGRGLAKLEAAGVEVSVGLLEAEARALNNAFACSITRKRPFVTLKAGLSVDGQLAPAPSTRTERAPFFLTGAEARAEVQQLRHASDAILCGIGTVLADDPLLTDRTGLPRRRPLMRVVLDTHLYTPLDSGLVRSSKQDLWLFCGHDAPADRAAALEAAGALITRVGVTDHGLELAAILQHLHNARILSVLLEAGSLLNGAFLRANLVDRVILYFAENELGHGAMPFAKNGPTPFALQQQLQHLESRRIGADIRVSGLLQDPWNTLTVLG
jgi:diaminohydroxyphosphoribosylaminopyrimidine deaminase/5-amino-6-(5-phosphoribosylamino)uracil reductase